jgi:hypothetical protein
MTTKKERLTDAEVAQRRDAAVRRALNTPPKPHKDMKVGRKPKTKGSSSAKRDDA